MLMRERWLASWLHPMHGEYMHSNIRMDNRGCVKVTHGVYESYNNTIKCAHRECSGAMTPHFAEQRLTL
jgi:hypothetical protein